MSSADKNLSDYSADAIQDSSGFIIGIVVAEWNREITDNLLTGAQDTLEKHGVSPVNIPVEMVPGSFELTIGARMMLAKYKLDALICLGCVVKGETSHDEYINHAVAHGLTEIQLYTGVPCIFGVVTTLNMEQARDRSGGQHGNKGVECAIAALQMAHLRRKLAGAELKIGFRK